MGRFVEFEITEKTSRYQIVEDWDRKYFLEAGFYNQGELITLDANAESVALRYGENLILNCIAIVDDFPLGMELFVRVLDLPIIDEDQIA